MSYDTIVMIIFGITILVFGIAYLVSKSKLDNGNTKTSNKISSVSTKNNTTYENGSYKKNPNAAIQKEDIFNFMEFDKIQDNMVIQQKGEKYTAIIKCKGINYNLMSEVEQLSVEEGFMTFLNTLKFPVQLYVQAQTVNLKSNIADYKQNMKGLYEEFDEVNSEYNSLLNSLDSEDDDIQNVEDKRSSILNVIEYGQDIVKYVEKLALNKSMLQRSFYVLVSYYKSELSNASSFNKEELLDICYSELFTRVQNIISGLSMCSVSSSILSSNEIAELLYSAYNRDDKNYMSLQQALESGFYRLYSTSEDAITKKNKKLVESLKKDAEYKAIVALNKAIEEGNLSTELDYQDAFDQESSKQAIEIIKKEKFPESVKKDAKKIIVEEYKKAKKERIEKQVEQAEKIIQKISSTNDVKVNENNQINIEETINTEENINFTSDANDSIV